MGGGVPGRKGGYDRSGGKLARKKKRCPQSEHFKVHGWARKRGQGGRGNRGPKTRGGGGGAGEKLQSPNQYGLQLPWMKTVYRKTGLFTEGVFVSFV